LTGEGGSQPDGVLTSSAFCAGAARQWPFGFKRGFRNTPTSGYVEFIGDCPEHGEQGGMDRVSKVVEYLRKHAGCRYDFQENGPEVTF
jgi:hypothetical protein